MGAAGTDDRYRALAGVGLKPAHMREILALRPQLGFFEVHAENYMGAGGLPHRHLRAVCEHYRLSIHGVGLSLGGAEDLDREHLGRLAALVRHYEPMLVSEHLAWSSSRSRYLGDLLPVPYTRVALERVASHIDHLQAVLGRRILLENPSIYLAFDESTWEETDFIAEIARRTGCGLLLDVNNVYVSTTNLGRDPAAYIAAYPMQRVEEIHLAGHVSRLDANGVPLLIDSHDRAVSEPVWSLYQRAIARSGPVPTLIERDAAIPPWSELHGEAMRASRHMAALVELRSTRAFAGRQEQFCEALLNPALPVPAGLGGPAGSQHAERFAVYRNNVAVGLIEALRSSFPVVNRLVGDEFFTAMARAYALETPPSSPVLLSYGNGFPDFVANFRPAAVLPYLADVALFEWLWLEAYHAGDADPLAIDNLQRVPVERLCELRLTLHPSVRLGRFSYPVVSIWRTHREEGEPAAMEIGHAPEQILFLRPCADVEIVSLSGAAAALLDAIRGGAAVADAARAALDEEPAVTLAELLSNLFLVGAFAGFNDGQYAVPAGEGAEA